MATELEKKERGVLQAIVAEYRRTNEPVCLWQIQEAMGFASSSTAHAYVTRLRARGSIKQIGKRGNVPTEKAMQALRIPLCTRCKRPMPE